LGTPGIPSFGSLITDTLTYIPHILLLFGILADMFTYQGVYSIPSLVGLLSIPLNWLFKFFWVGMFDTLGRVGDILASKPMKGGVFPFASSANTANMGTSTSPPKSSFFKDYFASWANTANMAMRRSPPPPLKSSFFKDYDGCTVQGFSWAASPYTPQTLVVTATVFSYYIFDLIMNRGWEGATAAIVFFLVLFLGETAVVGDCVVDNLEINKYLRALMAFSEGLLFGGSAYAVVQAYFPTFLPSSAIYPFPRVNVRDLKKNAAGQYVDDQGRPYIKGPNDQAIPDVSSKDGQSSWGSIYGQATGSPNLSFASGGVAGANCPVKK
jgi:hypothetical protein